MSDVTIKFEGDPRAIRHFVTWLCEAGEQDYWSWMEKREAEEQGDITIVEFDYWNNGRLQSNGPINGTIGRTDDEPICLCERCGKEVVESAMNTNLLGEWVCPKCL